MADPVSDVIVVGAGPAGLSVATRLRRRSVLVLNASKAPGWPPHCTGLVSPETARRLGEDAVTESFTEAVFLNDSFNEICRISGKPLAVRVSRPLLEEILTRRLEGMGHTLHNNMVVNDVRKECVHVRNKGWLCARDSVLIATGYSRFSRLFGAKHCDALSGLEVRVLLSKRINDEEFVTVHGGRYAPEFFTWIVPLNGGREALVGLAAHSDTVSRLAAFIHAAERKGLLGISKLVSHRGGRILRGPPARYVRQGRVYGLGDVLCASKPFTGGGLYAIAAMAQVLAEAIEAEDKARLESEWRALRSELLLQRDLTRLATVYRPLWEIGLVAACSAQDGCSISYDRHSSLLGCLVGGVRAWRKRGS